MPRLSIVQIVFAIAVGAIFAALQGDPPLPALSRLTVCVAPSNIQPAAKKG